MAADWVEILAGMPQKAVQEACIQYLRNEPRRKPTPGAILEMARMAMPVPTVVRNFTAAPVLAPDRVVVTKDQREAIMEDVGFRPKQVRGEDQ